MNQHQILVIENTSIMGAAIEKVLVNDTNLNVYGFVPKNKEELIRKIWRFRPDTIVVVEDTASFNPENLFKDLKEYPNLRIVVVSTVSNALHVFEKKTLITSPVVNLTAVVRGNQMEINYLGTKNFEFTVN